MPYTVQLDHTLRVTPLNTLFAKGDSAAHRFELTILRAGVQEDLTGCTVVCKFYHMAESTVVDVDGTIEDSKAVAVLKKACYDYIGRFVLTIAIKKGEEETTVFYGDGYMHGQRADTSISGEYIIYDINTLIEKIAEIDAATQAANTATSNANTATANANTATGKANTAASSANTAATNANTAKDAANAAAGKINNMTVSASALETGQPATAALSTVDGHYHLALGLPKGNTGATPRISVQVSTGAAGSEASVSVSGTAENPVIHLTIPRGDVGNIGALTINGKTPDGSGAVMLTAADVGALPSGGTAADSSKLGGKAPEYYLHPRNLLDNSDFRNPVNQRGNGDVNTQGDYPIDRWMFDENGSGCSAGYDANGKYLYIVNNATDGSWGSLYHNVPPEKLNAGTYTICFHEKLIGPISMIAIADDTVTVLESAIYEPDENGLIIAQFTISSRPSNKLLIAVYASQGITFAFDWAALYEGSYTADTLPPYVPNGYAAELAECQRYFVRLGIDNTYAFIGNGVMREGLKANIGINYNTTMRVLPTITFHGTFMLIPSFQDTTNLSIDCITRMSATIFCTIMSERPIGEACILIAKPNEMSYVDISADL